MFSFPIYHIVSQNIKQSWSTDLGHFWGYDLHLSSYVMLVSIIFVQCKRAVNMGSFEKYVASFYLEIEKKNVTTKREDFLKNLDKLFMSKFKKKNSNVILVWFSDNKRQKSA